MKKQLIITILFSFFTYAENDKPLLKLNNVSGIKVIKENNTNPICNNSEFGQCIEGISQYTSSIGDSIVTWNCTKNSLSISCFKNAEDGIAGLCGSSNNTTLSSIPSENLCLTGEASFITETNTNYQWSCSGNQGSQTIKKGNDVDCMALKQVSALNAQFTVTQSSAAKYGYAGSYSRFTSECAPYYNTGICRHSAGSPIKYFGNFIGESINPTFYLTYNEYVSISIFEFSGFAYNHSTYQTKMNIKYKDQNGQWQTAIDLMENGHPKSLKIMKYILSKPIVAKEFAIEAVISKGYFNLGYFKVLN